MPVYDYLCAQCGPFTRMRPMAESSVAHDCPTCGQDAPRAFLSAPYLATMSADRRLAHATNERSAAAPQVLSGLKPSHGSGCSCCAAKPPSSAKPTSAAATRNAAKSFPARRPWMLSH